MALDAIALTLLLMIADERADDTHGVVGKEHFTGFVDVPFQKESNHFWDIGLCWAAFQTA